MAQKINVVSVKGQGALLGYMDPKVGMDVFAGIHKGEISRVQGDLVHFGSGATEGRHTQYANLVYITTGDAMGSYSWPTGDGSVVLPYYHDSSDNSSGVYMTSNGFKFFSW